MTHIALETLATLPDRAAVITEYCAAGLSQDEAERLEMHAERIARIGRRAIVDIGSELLAAKQTAKHGTWLSFLGRAAIPERTAQHYMRVAAFFEDKPAKLAYLPPRLLPALAAGNASDGEIDRIICDIQAGEQVTAATVRERVAHPRYEPQHTDETFDVYMRAANDLGYTLLWDGRTGSYMLRGPGSAFSFVDWESAKQKIVTLQRTAQPLPFEPEAADFDGTTYEAAMFDDDDAAFGESAAAYAARSGEQAAIEDIVDAELTFPIEDAGMLADADDRELAAYGPQYLLRLLAAWLEIEADV